MISFSIRGKDYNVMYKASAIFEMFTHGKIVHSSGIKQMDSKFLLEYIVKRMGRPKLESARSILNDYVPNLEITFSPTTKYQ